MTAPIQRGQPDAGDRVVCEHAIRCGGCPLIELPYSEQLEQKARQVTGALAPYPALDHVRTLRVESAEPFVAYRTRAKLVVGPRGDLGLYGRGGHDVVDIPGCRVLAPVLSEVAKALRDRIRTAASEGGPLAPAGGERQGALRAVDLREVRDRDTAPRALVTWVLDRARAPDRSTLQREADAFLRTVPAVVGVAANFQRAGAAQILGSETVHLAGASAAEDSVGASRHLATFGSFVQAHRGQAARIHGVIAEAVRRGSAAPRVLDLYGGSGAIALGLASRGAQVHLVESFAPAVAEAEAAARRQGLALRAECADAAVAVQRLADAHASFDAVVLNPPRRGASPAVRTAVARLEPGTIVYVSCDPRTFARDLDHFARLGYVAATIQPFDMIPLTDEVEAVAVLERGEQPPPRPVYEDDEILVVDKGAHEATSSETRGSPSLTDRVRSLPGASGAVAVLPLAADESGLVVFARKADGAATWSRLFAGPSAKVDFAVGARGILRAKGTIAKAKRGGASSAATRTRYVRRSVLSGHSLARATPEDASSRTVRRHMVAVDHPVLGDEPLGDRATNRHFAEKYGLDRAFLHRTRIEVDDERLHLVVESPIPGDLQALLDRLAPSS
jgi:23S rRNA (uracil1939-C5)-methyltransferase